MGEGAAVGEGEELGEGVGTVGAAEEGGVAGLLAGDGFGEGDREGSRIRETVGGTDGGGLWVECYGWKWWDRTET